MGGCGAPPPGASGSMILEHLDLTRNPFTDRIAERTQLEEAALYMHSDLAGFTPREATYLFFGRRGSGKTTVRLRMQRAYEAHNASSASSPYLVVDLCKPGRVAHALRFFMERTGAAEESWDASFSASWTTADMVDCVLAVAATSLLERVLGTGPDANACLEALRADSKARKQFLLLAYLYAEADSASLATLRRLLLPPRTVQAAAAGVGVVACAAIAATASSTPSTAAALAHLTDGGAGESRVRTAAVTACALVGSALAYRAFCASNACAGRATELQQPIRVAPRRPVRAIVDALFASDDTAETIRANFIGNSTHQKLDLLDSLAKRLGFEGVAVFGDCFDEVALLDPVVYPTALKRFAREVCRNDFLNFGRMHFFFPDSRVALDLNTDRVLKDARFDRHFVRDLTWTRHQLHELAERRFNAALRHGEAQKPGTPPKLGGRGSASKVSRFDELFTRVKEEEFASCLSKLQTPRELLILMHELFSRMEAMKDQSQTLAAQDLEVCVQKAQEQAV